MGRRRRRQTPRQMLRADGALCVTFVNSARRQPLDRWAWAVDPDPDDLDRMLWPVLMSTAELLASEDRFRVRRCPCQGCGLFFIARALARRRSTPESTRQGSARRESTPESTRQATAGRRQG